MARRRRGHPGGVAGGGVTTGYAWQDSTTRCSVAWAKSLPFKGCVASARWRVSQRAASAARAVFMRPATSATAAASVGK